MIVDMDDEELSDLREALRLQLLRMLRDLTRAETPRVLRQLKERYERLDGLYKRLDGTPALGVVAVTH